MRSGLYVATLVKSGGISESFNERFGKLFPSIPMMIATLISFALVILILFFLLYKPIKKAMAERQKFIQKNIDEAKDYNKQAQAKLDEANACLSRAQEEAENNIKVSKIDGQRIIANYVSRAEMESKRIHEDASNDIKQQMEIFDQESKNKIAQAAVELSRQIIKKEVSKKTEDEIIDKFLKEA